MPTKEELEIRLGEQQAIIEQLQRERSQVVTGVGIPLDYTFREYPKTLYPKSKDAPLDAARVANDPMEEQALLAAGFQLTPALETCPAKK